MPEDNGRTSDTARSQDPQHDAQPSGTDYADVAPSGDRRFDWKVTMVSLLLVPPILPSNLSKSWKSMMTTAAMKKCHAAETSGNVPACRNLLR
eukprot:scaffold193172_cov36-Cyclotella_meneghiniana.AAC.4